MNLTRRSFFAGLLAPLVAPKLLEAAKGVSLAQVHAFDQEQILHYKSDVFYQMGVDFAGLDYQHDRETEFLHRAGTLDLCSAALHSKVMDAAAGRRVIWKPISEIVGAHAQWFGSIDPLPMCRFIKIYDIVEGRWLYRIDVRVMFTNKAPYKIGETIYVRRPTRFIAKDGLRYVPEGPWGVEIDLQA